MEKNINQSTINKNSELYAAIYEFAQGSCPDIIWETGNIDGSDNKKNDFFLSVVNTPTNVQLSTLNSPPAIVSSNFQNVQYIALYINILDSQARGFTRPIVLVFAYSGDTRNGNFMESLLCLHRKEFLDLAETLQKKAYDIFPSELKNYAIQLRNALSNDDKYKTLHSKFEELQRILPVVGITNLEDENLVQTEINPDSFNRINNDLRPIKDMIDFDNNVKKIIEFIEKLPKSQLQTTVVDGLGFNTDLFIQAFETDHSSDVFCLSRLLTASKKDIIYSLLCGLTLVLQIPSSKFLNDAEQFCKKLSMLTPFDAPLKIKYIQKIDLISKILEYDIIITEFCPNLVQKLPFALLNIKNPHEIEIETPLSCPAHSFVSNLISSTENIFMISSTSTNINENIFMIAIFNRIKHAYSKFLIKIAEISERTRQTRERMIDALKSFGFTPDDEPIFRYWIYSMASNASSSPNVKTIILNPKL